MTNPLHPGAMLLERLEIGWTGPDDELFNRAYRFRAWADQHPWEALRWRSKLRQAKYSPLRAHLWAAVERIAEGREEVAMLVAPTAPARFIQHQPPGNNTPAEGI